MGEVDIMVLRYDQVIQMSRLNGVDDECISLVEVFLDESDRLDSWTECLQCAPIGNDVDDMVREISHMWIAALCWKPVLASDMRVGMTFESVVDQKKRNDLADFLDRGGDFLRLS